MDSFILDDEGQDLSEYCLLMALISLIALGIFIHMSGGVQAIWSGSGAALSTASGSASGSTTGNSTASSPGN
jgi:Flp pilus assembly pilin Flp